VHMMSQRDLPCSVVVAGELLEECHVHNVTVATVRGTFLKLFVSSLLPSQPLFVSGWLPRSFMLPSELSCNFLS